MLSIIIPTHNRLPMLKTLLESVESQTCKDKEVIIVADACTDGTNEFLEKEASAYGWKYYINSVSLNAGGSRRRGFLESKGEYVAFVDDDDYFTDDNFYQEALNLFDKYPDLSVVAANSVNRYEDSGDFKSQEINVDGYMEGLKYLSGFQFKWYKPNPSFAVFRKAKLIDSGIMNMHMVNDGPLYMRALLAGDIYIKKDSVGVYRIHSTNISKSISADFIIENFEEKDYIYSRLKSLNVDFNLSEWWYRTVRLTFDYFMRTYPVKSEVDKVKGWCKSHLHRSIKLALYICGYNYMPLIGRIRKGLCLK